MEHKKLLFLKNLSVWYTAEHMILSDLSIDLEQYEIVGFIGLNGAGKTTFLKTIAGLVPDYRLDQALWNGDTFSFQDEAFKKNRYVVWAEDHGFRYFTFLEYLQYVAVSYDVSVSDISWLIKGFHFEDNTNVLFQELSTGNLKKAYLITAFALHPKLLLLDEPMNGLDFQSTEFLYQLMYNYKQYGTILFSSHILESICNIADRVMVLKNGKINQIFTGTQINTNDIRKVLHDYE